MKKVCVEFSNFFFSICDFMANAFTSISVLTLAVGLVCKNNRDLSTKINSWLTPLDAKRW